MAKEHFDVIVVGAGSGGGVLAARLTDDPSRRVLLLEAGPDFPGELDLQPGFYSGGHQFQHQYVGDHDWGYWSEPLPPENGNRRIRLPRGKMVGGSSMANAQMLVRAAPHDFERWQAAGATGWTYDALQPCYEAVEQEVHTKCYPRSTWQPVQLAFEESLLGMGYTQRDDMNAPDAWHGTIGATPINRINEVRQGTLVTYIRKARHRENLVLRPDTLVDRVLIEGGRATGVRAIGPDGVAYEVTADQVVLCGGAYGTPSILMRSGIGPAAHLREHGISVVADRPGVGANLQNHPVAFLGMHLRKSARQPATLRTTAAVSMRFSSGLDGCAASDLYINVQSKSSWSALGLQLANVAPALLQPLSRGTVTLASPHANDYPRIDFNFLSHELDLARMSSVFIRAAELAIACGSTTACGTPFPVPFGNRIRELNELNRANAIKTSLIAKMLDLMPVLADRLLSNTAGKNIVLRDVLADPARLKAHMLENTTGVFHPAGTCRMGAAGDAGAVVDPQGRVYGIDGLRVADASIMPLITSANTNIPTLMIAEKIAAAVVDTP